MSRLDAASGAVVMLREVQKLFWRLIVAPEGVPRALEEARTAGSTDAEAVEAVFAGDDRMPAAARLDVYANMYFFRLKDAMREDVPKTAAVLGEARYHNLVTDYLLAHPSSRWSLRWAAKELPSFLRLHPYGRDVPWLADLAALEWAHADALQAVDSEPETAEELAKLPPEAWPELRFEGVAGVRLLSLSWDVPSIWDDLTALEETGSGEVPGAEARAVAVLVSREGFDARHRVLEGPEADAVRLLLSAQPFAEVCEVFGGPDEEPEVAGQRAVALLARLVAAGVLVREAPRSG